MSDKRFVINNNNANKRLDVFLEKSDLSFSRSQIKLQIKKGNVLVNGETVKAGYKLKFNDIIQVLEFELPDTSILPENINLNVVYDDEIMVIVNKPQNMVVHPAVGNYSGTLVNALLYNYGTYGLSNVNGEDRPGIVHRLDKDTSGLMMIAKNNETHKNLAEQLKNREVKKLYYGLVNGNIKKDSGEISSLIDRNKKNRLKMAVSKTGKEAVTKYNVVKRFKGYCLVEFDLVTGRTHQIRVHAKHLGHPLVGDELYGIKHNFTNVKGQMLHSHKLEFVHPKRQKTVTFSAELPQYFKDVINSLTEI